MINFTDFCADKDDPREHLRAPFIVDDATVYTNGHAILITPINGAHQPYAGKSIRNYQGFIERSRSIDYATIDNIVIPEKIKCYTCEGTGRASISKCEECDGEGSVEFSNKNNDYDCECKSCDGDGRITQAGGDTVCTDCAGNGKHYKLYAHVTVAGIPINANYYDMIMSLPNVQFNADRKDKLELYFKSDIGIGCVMGLRI